MAEVRPTEDQIREFINTELKEFAAFAVATLEKEMIKLGLSGRAAASVYANFTNATADGKALSTIFFETYARFQDLKNRKYTKSVTPEILESLFIPWVKARGIAKFQYVPGYKKGITPSEEIAIARIARGVAFGLKRSVPTRKTRYSKKKAFLIKRLTQNLAVGYRDVIARSTAQQLSS